MVVVKTAENQQSTHQRLQITTKETSKSVSRNDLQIHQVQGKSARVRNELPMRGLDSTDVCIYKGALLPVELSRRHPQIVVCSSPGRADHTYLDTVAQTACAFLVLFY